MKIIYLGTPEFAVLPLEALLKDGHEVALVVTQPDKPTGRTKKITPPPLKIYAQSLGIKVAQFDRIRDNAEQLREINADIMITCAYGQILTKEILQICPYGVLNIHASLLPKYRGASPIQHAILNGDHTTGITVMKTDIGLDTGDILLQSAMGIDKNDTAASLSDRLSKLGGGAVCDALKLIESGKAVYTKQDESLATYVRTVKKADARLDFDDFAENIVNKIRAFNPKPIVHCLLRGQMLKIFDGEIAENSFSSVRAGEVIAADKTNGLIIACKIGAVKIITVQPAGKNIMSAKAYILGGKIKPKDILE